MPDEAHSQTDFSVDIAARRQARAMDAAPPVRTDPRIDGLLQRIADLETWRDNLQGANGISVNGGIISYTAPAITATLTLNCDADPPTGTIIING